MVKVPNLVLSEHTLTALYYIYQYRYLTVTQVARLTGLRPKSASEMLLRLERQKLLGFFGNTGIRGYGKTPKVYYLTKRGYAILAEEQEFNEAPIGAFKSVNISSRWSPQMYHRLATLDVIVSLEKACQSFTDYRLQATFVEYRREKHGGRWVGETTDFVDISATSENRIVPDAGFVLENTRTGKRALFLIETDLGTERHTTRVTEAMRQSFHHKIEKYDRYLISRRFRDRYNQWGEFDHFVLLVVTTSDKRIENMRNALSDLSTELHQYYRFSTLDAVLENFFHNQWLNRAAYDDQHIGLIQMRGKNES